jgi:hypothetical protein
LEFRENQFHCLIGIRFFSSNLNTIGFLAPPKGF